MMNQQDYQENLPFYINGTLSKAEQADFESELSNNNTLKKEADFLTTLRKQIKSEQIKSPGQMGLHRLKRDIKNQASNDTVDDKQVKKWRLFAVAASLLIAMQTGFIVSMTPEEATYVPLSGSEYNENIVQIQFKDKAKANDISELLIQFNASIIEGPSKNGLYRVHIKNLDNDLMNQLQSSSDVIDFIAEE